MLFRTAFKTIAATLLGLICIPAVYGQSGHSNRSTGVLEGTILSVTAIRKDGTEDPIRAGDLFLYENAVEQKIKNFSFDPSPARIVLLVDNSQTVPASTSELQKAIMEFVYEIYDGDQLFVIAYDEKPEIIQEWTDDADKLKASLETLRKQGNPYLFDALNASVSEVLVPLMPGTRKTAVVIIGDGLDRGSRTPFEGMLSELQDKDVTVYALQLKDRTGGAYRRYSPKAGKVIDGLTKKTGGIAFPFGQAKEAAKFICDELRKNRYLLSYFPTNTSTYDARRLFVTGPQGIELRFKAAQPPNIK